MAKRETKVSYINHWRLLRENKVTRIVSVLQYTDEALSITPMSMTLQVDRTLYKLGTVSLYIIGNTHN